MKADNRQSAEVTSRDDEGVIVLDEDVGIADAGDLKTRLLGLMEAGDVVTVDGSQVKVVDTAILQLLVAAFSHACAQGKTITWQQPSEALCSSAVLLGLEGHLSLEAAAK